MCGPFFPRYWHIYAGPHVQFGEGVWLTVVAGPTEYAVPPEETLESGARWVQTLDHHPSEDEVAVHVPQWLAR